MSTLVFDCFVRGAEIAQHHSFQPQGAACDRCTIYMDTAERVHPLCVICSSVGVRGVFGFVYTVREDEVIMATTILVTGGLNVSCLPVRVLDLWVL